MLDAATKAQLKSYLERATQPIEIVAYWTTARHQAISSRC